MSANQEEHEKLKKEQPDETNVYYDKKPDFIGNEPSKLRATWEKGKVYILVIAAGIVMYFVLLRLSDLKAFFSEITGILTPIFIGVVFAYLINPLVGFIETPLHKLFQKRMKNTGKAKNLSRGIGILISILLTIILLVTLSNMVIPELYRSIRNLIFSLPDTLNLWLSRLNDIDLGTTPTSIMLKNLITDSAEMLQNWLRTDLLKQVNVIMSGLTEGIFFAVNTVLNLLIGVIVSIYLLFSKEKFLSQAKKTLYAFIKPETANKTLHIFRKSNEIFGGFITGKIIDSAIIGVLCFIILSIFNMPYTLLVSVIIGITNIIPFFGPFIGAVPSAILILLEDPKMGLIFIVIVILLQQLDGNVIGPKILGNSTGLPAFWVIFSILIGGGLFGFIGMIMGVPTFSVIYYIIQMVINQKLQKKDLPTHSENYDEMSFVNLEGDFIKQPLHQTDENSSNKKEADQDNKNNTKPND